MHRDQSPPGAPLLHVSRCDDHLKTKRLFCALDNQNYFSHYLQKIKAALKVNM